MRSRRSVASRISALLAWGVLSAPNAAAATAPAAAATSTSTSTSTPSSSGEAPIDGRYREFGDGGGFLDLLPPGQSSGLTTQQLEAVKRAAEGDGEFPGHYADQRTMYDALVHAPLPLEDDDLGRYFKDASFGVAPDDIDRVYRPHPDVVVIRDKSAGVPHIFGRTRYATMYAQGYATAEDRLFLLDVLRHAGRGRLTELVGEELGLARDRGVVGSSPYRERDLTAQLEALRASGPDGPTMVEDLEAYGDGVNAFIAALSDDAEGLPVEYELLGAAPQPWEPEDAVAIASLVGGLFGRGGGRELANYCRLEELTRTLDGDAAAARAVFDDLTFDDVSDSPVTSPDPAPYLARPARPDPPPPLRCASLSPISAASPSVDEIRGLGGLGSTGTAGDPVGASNALLIAGEHTDDGRPIAVFGPQVGYSAPELLVEKDVHGPGIDARGVGFVGIDFYVLLGRGDTYAWSATSSGADNVDDVVLELCDPGGNPTATPSTASTASTGYRRGTDCLAFETWEHELTAPDGDLVERFRVERAPDYGPVLLRGSLADGTPVAITERRSTYGSELSSALGFKQLNDPEFMRPGWDAFREATGEHVDFAFNWFYVDGRDIGYQHSCRCPLRPAATDPRFPVWAEGAWTGFLAPDDQPRARNPDQGYLVSWNNRQAPGFGASDGQFSYGPVHRSLLLSRRAEGAVTRARAGEPVDRAGAVGIMIDAATADLRGAEVLPVVLDVMGEPPADDPRLADLRERLEIWADQGAHRVDRDGDSAYDDPGAPAVADAWWPHLVEAVFGAAGKPFETLGIGIDDSPRGHGGSAFLVGAYGHVVADLRPLADPAVESPFTRHYCGAGDTARCAAALWDSLRSAIADLEEEFASGDVADWARVPADDEIRYRTMIAPMPSIDWQNRPTFQQVVQLESTRHRTRESAGPPRRGRGGDPPVWPFIAAAAILLAVVAGRARRRGA